LLLSGRPLTTELVVVTDMDKPLDQQLYESSARLLNVER